MSDIVFPKFDDTVELYVVGLYGGFYPIIVIILVELFNANLYCCQNKTRTDRRGRLRRFAITLFHGLSLFIFGAGLTLLLTESNFYFYDYLIIYLFIFKKLINDLSW